MTPGSSKGKRVHGVIVPIVTPITKERDLDEPALKKIVEFLITGGVHGIFVLGTTGEGPYVPREMRARLVNQTLEFANGRVPVYAGVHDMVVDQSISAAKDYLRRGVAAVVSQLPGYFLLSAKEQFNFYALLAEHIPGPIILYDMPIAVHQGIDPSVIEHLRVFPNVVGIKDSSGDRQRLEHLLSAYGDDPLFSVLVGASALASFGFQHGADGYVPSGANVDPALCVRLYASALKGDAALMGELQQAVVNLQNEFGGDTLGQTIARLKRSMSSRGLCSPMVFPPLQPSD